MTAMNDWPKCDGCGRFMNLTETHLVRMVYSGFPPEPDHEAYTCHACMFVDTPVADTTTEESIA